MSKKLLKNISKQLLFTRQEQLIITRFLQYFYKVHKRFKCSKKKTNHKIPSSSSLLKYQKSLNYFKAKFAMIYKKKKMCTFYKKRKLLDARIAYLTKRCANVTLTVEFGTETAADLTKKLDARKESFKKWQDTDDKLSIFGICGLNAGLSVGFHMATLSFPTSFKEATTITFATLATTRIIGNVIKFITGYYDDAIQKDMSVLNSFLTVVLAKQRQLSDIQDKQVKTYTKLIKLQKKMKESAMQRYFLLKMQNLINSLQLKLKKL